MLKNPNEKVLVFGGSGFLGSHVCNKLSKEGYQVTIFDKKKSNFLDKDQQMIQGDITSEIDVKNAIKENIFVFNFAGLSEIDLAQDNPIATVKQNILGNCIILDSCKDLNVERYIFASSIYVYSDRGGFYSASKQACENYIENYYKSYDLNYTILRYGSLYGPRSDQMNGIYRFIYEALTKKEIVFNGNDDAIREFIHVEDAADCTVNILNKDFINQHIILTGQQIYKISDLLNMIKEILQDKNIQIKYNLSENIHYRMTPYTFNPKIGKKMSPDKHIDLGQGLLQVIDEVYRSINNN